MSDHFISFVKDLSQNRIQLATFIFISLLALSLPGQNRIQTLSASAQTSPLNSSDITLPLFSDIPILPPEIQPPDLSAGAGIAIDIDSATVVYQHNPDARMLPASTTKIMTALVALTDYDLDEVVTITNADQSVGHTAELVSGEQFTVEDLLYALMLSSGNDAAVALAQHHPQGYFGFINRMNILAREYHLDSTHFTTASGIENEHHFTTARDLSILTKQALTHPKFAQIVATSERSISNLNGNNQHYLVNINNLLGKVPGLIGVKTGWTENAGECLVTYTNRDGHRIITVLLNSQDRFGESETLIEWIYQNYIWTSPETLINLGAS